MQTILEDVRYSLRLLRKSPGFAFVALFALALGIGANTAIFSVVNGVLLRPLPYRDPSRLVMIYENSRDFNGQSVAYPNFQDWRRDNHSFLDLAAFRGDDFNYTGAGQPEHLAGEYASASLLPVLGVQPLLGRNFLPNEDQPGAGGVVLLSYGLWQRRFGGDPQVVGRSMTLNARSYTVIGVLPSDFRFRDHAEIYTPLAQWPSVEINDREVHPGLHVIGRLRPGFSLVAAQADLSAIARRLAVLYPKSNAGHGVSLVDMKDDMVSHIRPTLLLLLGAVGLVLLIACANVANLLLARSTARKQEFAIRTALGAPRRRMVRQLLTESVLLAVGAGMLGLALAYWGTQAVLATVPDTLPRAQGVGLDPYVLLFTLAVSVVTGMLFGLFPALQTSGVNPHETLREGTRRTGGGRRRMEGVIAAFEMGVAVVLLAGAGLMIQSIWRLWRVNPGFETQHILTAQVALSPKVMNTPAAIRSAYDQMLGRVKAIPGVRAAAFTNLVPLSDNDDEIPFWTGTGAQPPQDRMQASMFYIATQDYLRAMSIPLLRGRFLNEHDTTATKDVVVIDEVMAKRLFPKQDPIGQHINLMVFGPVEIVGVAGHVKHWGLDADDSSKIRDQIYFSMTQVPDKFMAQGAVGLTIIVRTETKPLTYLSAVRSQVAGPTNDQPMFGVQTMEQIISSSLAERRFTMLLLILFAATALVLASVGIYGVMSYSVTRRTHELGVRVALGATQNDVLGLVLREGMAMALVGILCGIVAALGLTRLMASLLYGVQATDPVTLFSVCAALGAVAFFATYIPGRRATRVDPIVALRYE